MAKKQKKANVKTNTKSVDKGRLANLHNVLVNAVSTRRELLEHLLNLEKDINYECGYPETITITDYKAMYDREGLGTRVVNLLPDESWAMLPEIEENKDVEETEFEKVWKDLDKKRHLFHYLHRVDVLSGIGRFGLLLLGLNDGKELSEPVEGIDLRTGEKTGNKNHELLYLRPFDESVVTIKTKEADVSSPRFGKPVSYSVDFEDSTSETTSKQTKIVHWTRVLHVFDNRAVSEVYGIPRMKPVYNRLLDLRKIVAGSGEMFWKGAFPGYALKVDPTITLTDDQKTIIREEMKDYQDGLQRYLAIGGVEIQELTPQVSDPKPHIESQMRYIAITLGIPFRIFQGSEAAHLASDQDITTWNKRIAKRQEGYLSPMLVRLLIDRLIIFGVMPDIDEEYFIMWPDLNIPGEKEAAEISAKKTEAYAKYVAGSVDELIPPKEYFTMIMGMSDEDAEAIIKASMKFGEDLAESDGEQSVREAEEAAARADADTQRQIEIEKVKAETRRG